MNPDTVEVPSVPSTESIDNERRESWCASTEEYVKSLIERATTEADIHKKHREFYAIWKHTLGIPNIMIGAVFSSLEGHTSTTVSKVAFISNAFIASLNYYFQFPKKECLHKTAYDQYIELINTMNQCLSMPRTKRRRCREVIDSFSKEYARILNSSP